MIEPTISHYRVLRLLGAGAMGEVYLAEDTELGRQVALKVLPPGVANDQKRIRRFKQEAKAASALNHPNILTVYEIGQFEGTHFIASEYIKGEDLRQRQRREPLNLREALEVAIQLASALNAAHEAGIIHRDIKLENIMLREDGLVKVLDFGLAKLNVQQPQEIDRDALTIYKTAPGVIIGTVAYMSPEQARGKEIDARSDIWGMGVCLYEMLAGRLPFFQETVSDTIASILKSDFQPLGENVPSELSRIVRKALQKDRDSRYQTMKDFLLDLKTFKHDLEFAEDLERSKSPPMKEAVAPALPSGRRKRAFMISLAVLLIAGIAVGLWYRRHFANLEALRHRTEVRQHYSDGRNFWRQRNKASLAKAREQFESAIAKDPNYAPAYAGLADTYVLAEEYLGTPSKIALQKAEENAKKALQINHSLAEAHASLAFIKTKQWEWDTAKKEFELAITLDPSYSTAYHWYNIYLRNVGDYDEALKQIKFGSDVDPKSEIIRVNIIITYLVRGNGDAAIEEAKKLLALNPNHWAGRCWLGMAHLEQGREDEAISDLEVGVSHSGRLHTLTANLGYAYAVTGRDEKAYKIRDELESLYKENKATGQGIAKIYAGLGKKNEAFEWLEKDFVSHSGDLSHIAWHPAFKSLQNDPRYADLLRRMGLQPKNTNSR